MLKNSLNVLTLQRLHCSSVLLCVSPPTLPPPVSCCACVLQVRELPDDVIRKHLHKLMFYYGQGDPWCPVQYYHVSTFQYHENSCQLEVLLGVVRFPPSETTSSSAVFLPVLLPILVRNASFTHELGTKPIRLDVHTIKVLTIGSDLKPNSQFYVMCDSNS